MSLLNDLNDVISVCFFFNEANQSKLQVTLTCNYGYYFNGK